MHDVIRRATLALAAAVLFAAPLDAQPRERRAPNAVFLELLGNGGLWSVNYDRKLNETFSVRGGYARWTSIELGDGVAKRYRFYVLMFNALVGDGPHRFELGTGARVGSYHFAEYGWNGRYRVSKATSTFGYRYQPRGPSWIFRLGIVPEYSVEGYQQQGASVNGAVSVGRSF